MNSPKFGDFICCYIGVERKLCRYRINGKLNLGWIVTYMLLVHKCCWAVVVMLLIFLIDVVAGKI